MLSAFDNFSRMGFAVPILGPLLPIVPTTLDPATLGDAVVLSNGNLTVTANMIDMPDNANSIAFSTVSHSTGKYYWEVTIGPYFEAGFIFNGVANSATQTIWEDNGIGSTNNSAGWFVNGTAVGVNAPNYVIGDVLGLAVDFDAKNIWVIDWSAETPEWNLSESANPASGVGGASFSAITGPYFAAVILLQGAFAPYETFNFGVQPFTGSIPNGFGYF